MTTRQEEVQIEPVVLVQDELPNVAIVDSTVTPSPDNVDVLDGQMDNGQDNNEQDNDGLDIGQKNDGLDVGQNERDNDEDEKIDKDSLDDIRSRQRTLQHVKDKTTF